VDIEKVTPKNDMLKVHVKELQASGA